MRAHLAIPAALAALALAPRAAATEREWQVGVDLGVASLSLGDAGATGPRAGAHLTYGLTDAFDLHARLDGARWGGLAATALAAHAGVAYTLDVTRWVPHLGLAGGVTRISGGAGGTAPSAELFVGVDYRVDRRWVVGVQGGTGLVFLGDPSGTATSGGVLLRLGRVWGF